MGIFSGEGLGLNFPPGGGAIFQPRGGQGGGVLRSGIFNVQMLSFTIQSDKLEKAAPAANFLLKWIRFDKICCK